LWGLVELEFDNLSGFEFTQAWEFYVLSFADVAQDVMHNFVKLVSGFRGPHPRLLGEASGDIVVLHPDRMLASRLQKPGFTQDCAGHASC
jgi:hypothetical protein